jgi:hypothetical protein
MRADGGVHVFLGRFQAVGIGARDLQLVEDQALEHLAFQHVGRRQLVFLAGVLVGDVGDGAGEFALQDDVFVHDRHRVVDRLERLGMHGHGNEQAGGSAKARAPASAWPAKRGSEGHGVGSGSVSVGGWPVAVSGGTR